MVGTRTSPQLPWRDPHQLVLGFARSKSCRTRGFVGVLLANFHHFSFADAMPTNQHEKSQKIRKRMEFLLRKSTIQPHSQSVLDNIFIIIVLL